MKNPYMKKRVKKESSVEKHLVEYAKQLGGQVRKVTFPGHSGAPDRLILFPGGVVAWVELKSTTGKTKPWQDREHQRFRAMGQRVDVIRTEHEADRLIDELYAESMALK